MSFPTLSVQWEKVLANIRKPFILLCTRNRNDTDLHISLSSKSECVGRKSCALWAASLLGRCALRVGVGALLSTVIDREESRAGCAQD